MTTRRLLKLAEREALAEYAKAHQVAVTVEKEGVKITVTPTTPVDTREGNPL
jgi:hypothetical protein